MEIDPDAYVNIAYNLMIGAPLTHEIISSMAYQINQYTQRIALDDDYHKLPKKINITLSKYNNSSHYSSNRKNLPYNRNQ